MFALSCPKTKGINLTALASFPNEVFPSVRPTNLVPGLRVRLPVGRTTKFSTLAEEDAYCSSDAFPNLWNRQSKLHIQGGQVVRIRRRHLQKIP